MPGVRSAAQRNQPRWPARAPAGLGGQFMPTGMPDLAKRLFLGVAHLIDTAPGGNAGPERDRRRQLVKDANQELGSVDWTGLDEPAALAVTRDTLRVRVLEHIDPAHRGQLTPGYTDENNSVDDVLDHGREFVENRSVANLTSNLRAAGASDEPAARERAAADTKRIADLPENRIVGPPYRSQSGRMRNLKAMSDTKWQDLIVSTPSNAGREDPTGLEALRAEDMRRGTYLITDRPPAAPDTSGFRNESDAAAATSGGVTEHPPSRRGRASRNAARRRDAAGEPPPSRAGRAARNADRRARREAQPEIVDGALAERDEPEPRNTTSDDVDGAIRLANQEANRVVGPPYRSSTGRMRNLRAMTDLKFRGVLADTNMGNSGDDPYGLAAMLEETRRRGWDPAQFSLIPNERDTGDGLAAEPPDPIGPAAVVLGTPATRTDGGYDPGDQAAYGSFDYQQALDRISGIGPGNYRNITGDWVPQGVTDVRLYEGDPPGSWREVTWLNPDGSRGSATYEQDHDLARLPYDIAQVAESNPAPRTATNSSRIRHDVTSWPTYSLAEVHTTDGETHEGLIRAAGEDDDAGIPSLTLLTAGNRSETINLDEVTSVSVPDGSGLEDQRRGDLGVAMDDDRLVAVTMDDAAVYTGHVETVGVDQFTIREEDGTSYGAPIINVDDVEALQDPLELGNQEIVYDYLLEGDYDDIDELDRLRAIGVEGPPPPPSLDQTIFHDPAQRLRARAGRPQAPAAPPTPDNQPAAATAQASDTPHATVARGLIAGSGDHSLQVLTPNDRYARIVTNLNHDGTVRDRPRTLAYVRDAGGVVQLTLTRGSAEEIEGAVEGISGLAMEDRIGVNGYHVNIGGGIDAQTAQTLLRVARESTSRGGASSPAAPSTQQAPEISRTGWGYQPQTHVNAAQLLVDTATSELPGDEEAPLQVVEARNYARIINANGDTVAYVRTMGGDRPYAPDIRVTFVRGEDSDITRNLRQADGHAASVTAGLTVNVHTSDPRATGPYTSYEQRQTVSAQDEFASAARALLLAQGGLPRTESGAERSRPRRGRRQPRPAAPAPIASGTHGRDHRPGTASIDGSSVPRPNGTIEDRTFGVENEIKMRGSARASVGGRNTAIQALESANIAIYPRHLHYGDADRVGNMQQWTSMNDPTATGGPEVITAPLKGEEGLEQLETGFTALAAAGATQGPQSSHGLHVHIDVRDLDRRQVDAVTETYARNAAQIDELVSPRRRTVQFAGYAHAAIGTSHYTAMNTQHVNDDRGTIEIRRLGSNMDPKTISDWVRLWRALIQHCKDTGQPMPSVNSLHDLLELLPDEYLPRESKQRLEARAQRVAEGTNRPTPSAS